MALCGLLLVWIFHSIFVDTARRATQARPGGEAEWSALSRSAQWDRGWREGPPRLWATLLKIDPGAFVGSIGLMGASLALGVIRWRSVLRVQGLHLSFGRAFEITLVAHFFNSFLLGSTGGDLMKAYYAARETHHRKTEAVVTVFVDRLVGLWSMLLFAGVMLVPNLWQIRKLDRVGHLAMLMVAGLFMACSLVMILAFWGGLTRRWAGARTWLRRLPKGVWLERSLDSCRLFGRDRAFLARAIGLSTLLNAVVVAQWWMVARGLGLTLDPVWLLLVVPSVICLAALPFTPSGLGVRENLVVHLLERTTESARSLSLSLLAFAGSLIWSLIGGVVYLLFRDRHHLAEADLNGGTEPPV